MFYDTIKLVILLFGAGFLFLLLAYGDEIGEFLGGMRHIDNPHASNEERFSGIAAFAMFGITVVAIVKMMKQNN